MKRKITLCTCALNFRAGEESEYARRLEMAMEAGFEGFEISMFPKGGSYDAFLRAFAETGAKVVSVHGMLGGDCCSPDPAIRRQAAQDALEHLKRFSDFAPCPATEHYYDRFNDRRIADYFRDTVERELEGVEKLGFTYCMENAPYKPEYNERFPPLAEVAAFVRSFDGRMAMTFDVNHANLHEDLVEACNTASGIIRHIHVSDNHGSREEHLLPGQGIIDFPAIFKALDRNGYAGTCNLECKSPALPITLESLKALHSNVSALLEQAGIK